MADGVWELEEGDGSGVDYWQLEESSDPWVQEEYTGNQTVVGGAAVSSWVALAGIALMGAVSATPAVSTAQWTTPVPSRVAVIVATPAPSISQWVAPQPSAVTSRIASASASVSTWAAPVPVAVRGAVIVAPSVASTAQWTAPVPTAVRGVAIGAALPSVFTWTVAVPSGGAATLPQTGSSGVAVSSWAVPVPSSATSVVDTAAPGTLEWVVPSPSATAGGVVGVALPSVAAWSSPVPSGGEIAPRFSVTGASRAGPRYSADESTTGPRIAGEERTGSRIDGPSHFGRRSGASH